MRFGQDQSTSTIGNRGGAWRIATSLLVLTIVLLTASPIATIAQGEGLSTAEVPAEAPAMVEPVAEQPTAVPVQPTSVPPTAVPPTAVPPTVVPPTVIPTAVPTQVPPTAVPTAVPTQEPTAVPTEKVWVNTDALRVTDGVTTHTVQQGASATVSITYTVTTPRSSTTVYARLSGAADGWTISSPQLPDGDPVATAAAWTEAATLQPGTAFTLPIVITAPTTVAQDHAVSLHLWSVAAGEKGQEIGVANTDLRIVTVTALAPPPTPTPAPTPSPTPMPRLGLAAADPPFMLTCVPTVATVDPTLGYAAFRCTVNRDKEHPMHLTATFSASTVGWQYSIPEVTDGFTSVIPTGAQPKKLVYDVYLRPDPNATTVSRTATLNFGGKPTNDANFFVVPLNAMGEPVSTDMSMQCLPEHPGLAINGSTTVTCIIDGTQLLSTVTIQNAKVNAGSGWQVNVSGGAPAASITIPVGTQLPGATGSTQFRFTLTRNACTTTAPAASVSTTYSYGSPAVMKPGPEATVTVSPTGAVSPSVTLSGPIDFGPLTWDGTSYGSSIRSVTATINREGACGGEYNINLSVESVSAGIDPRLTGAEKEGNGLSLVSQASDSTAAPVTVARIDPTFTGQGTVDIELTLEPGSEADPGTHNMTIHVKAENGN